MFFKEEPLINTDCFAYNQTTNKCNACNDLKCKNCAFYKKTNTSKKRKIKPVEILDDYTVAD